VNVAPGFEERLGRVVARWVGGARRAAAWVLLGSLAVATGSAFYAGRNLGINADIDSLISSDVPYRQLRDEFEAVLPHAADVLLVVVDAPSAEQATQAADALAERFAREVEAFRGVFVPGGGPFFEKNALLYLDVEELEELADHLAAAQPFLGAIASDPSLRGILRLPDLLFDAVQRDETTALDPAQALDRVSGAFEAVLAGRAPPLGWDEILVGEQAMLEEPRRVVILSPVLDYEDLQPARQAMTTVRRVTQELGYDEGPVRVRITGFFALSYEEMQVVRGQAARAGVASFVLVALLLVVALRSGWLILCTLVTLLVGLTTSFGFAALAVGHLNPVSVAFAVLFIGLSVDFGIHLCLRYQELRSAGGAHDEALAETSRGVGGSLVLCALTTAIGFYAFVPTDFLGVAELGLIAGTGMLISLFFSLTLLPALLSLTPLARGSWSRPPRRSLLAGSELPRAHPVAVRAVALLAALGALALVPRAHFDFSPLRVRDPNTESVQALEDLLSSSDASPWTVSLLARDHDAAREIARRLETLDVVARAVSPMDFVPSHQEAKLEILEEIAVFMGPAPVAREAGSRDVDAQIAALDAARDRTASLRDETPDEELADGARRLHTALSALRQRFEDRADREAELLALEAALIDPIHWRLRRLHGALGAKGVGWDDLPAGLLNHAVAVDGRVRVQVFPSEDLNENVALERFVEGVRLLEPQAVGSAADFLESGRAIVRSFQQALVFAAIAIVLLLIVLWRRVADAVVVVAVLAFSALLTTAGAVLVQIPFNYADVIVLPLLLGIGVDSSIHLVHRYRTEAAAREHLLGTSTARAVFYSALTTIASFGSLGFAAHRGMATMGQLLTLGVTLVLVSNLVVLPALLPRRRATASDRR
jgi:hopanoid biosynthesis associated RND transporter like protein HpnN